MSKTIETAQKNARSARVVASALFTLGVTALVFSSCASAPKKDSAVVAAPPVSNSPSATVLTAQSKDPNFTPAASLKEMTAEDAKVRDQNVANFNRELKLSVLEKSGVIKGDQKMSWKCTARAGQKSYSKSAKDALVAKNNAQKACEAKKSAKDCIVTECIPTKRI